MVTARHAASIVQALLDHSPVAIRGEDEAVEIDLKAICDRIVVDARSQPTCAHQSIAVEAATVGDRTEFVRRIARESAAPAANIKTQLFSTRSEAALERAHNGSRDSRGVPIHPHDRAQRLKPKRIAQSREKRRSAVIMNDGFGDGRAKFGHALGEPLRHAAAMQRQICGSGAFHWEILEYLVSRPNQSTRD